MIIIATASFVFDQQQVEKEVVSHLAQILGTETAENINDIVQKTQRKDRDFLAIIIGLLTLFFGATGLFAHLQRSLNKIFEVKVRKSASVISFLKTRLISFGMVLMIGFLLLISLSLTSIIVLLNDWIAIQISPSFSSSLVAINMAVSFSIIVTLFTMIYKILPDATIKLRSAVMGALIAAIFFTIGEHGLNYYFQLAKPQSSFGAAGSLVLLMIWVSYSCMILFIGAEFSKHYEKDRFNKKIKPTAIAKNG